jgi:Sec7-like guanine-nucleotide exchange factor
MMCLLSREKAKNRNESTVYHTGNNHVIANVLICYYTTITYSSTLRNIAAYVSLLSVMTSATRPKINSSFLQKDKRANNHLQNANTKI